MRKFLCFVFCILILSPVCFAAQRTLSFDQVITAADKIINTRYYILGNDMRMERNLEGKESISLVKDGYYYTYDPAANTAVKMELRDELIKETNNYPQDYKSYLKSKQAVYSGFKIIDKKYTQLYSYKLSPSTSIKVWLWKGANFPLKMQFIHEDGRTMEIRWTNINFDPELDPGLFEFDPDTKIIDLID